MNKLRIAIVVHGRFNAFDFANALINRGHYVKIFTNYPKWATVRFGLSKKCVVSFVVHGVLSRVIAGITKIVPVFNPEEYLHKLFSMWSAKKLRSDDWDVIYVFSGVAEEILDFKKKGVYPGNPLTVLMRASSHIRSQHEILSEEESRVGFRIDKPSGWMIQREESEYKKTDLIRVISTFAYESFLSKKIDSNKIKLILSADPVENFKPSQQTLDIRVERILRGDPLRIIFVGALSYQKGLYDLKIILKEMKGKVKFTLVGPINSQELDFIAEELDGVTYLGKVKQHQIASYLNESDIFLFPTLQEGYAQVIAQAMASGLPVMTTTNCQGPDVLRQGVNGWVFPIRNPQAFIEQLKWCDVNRVKLSEIVKEASNQLRLRTFKEVAQDFERITTNPT